MLVSGKHFANVHICDQMAFKISTTQSDPEHKVPIFTFFWSDPLTSSRSSGTCFNGTASKTLRTKASIPTVLGPAGFGDSVSATSSSGPASKKFAWKKSSWQHRLEEIPSKQIQIDPSNQIMSQGHWLYLTKSVWFKIVSMVELVELKWSAVREHHATYLPKNRSLGPRNCCWEQFSKHGLQSVLEAGGQMVALPSQLKQKEKDLATCTGVFLLFFFFFFENSL